MHQDFRNLWKKLANEKRNTRRDHVHYCILKAIAAKSDDKVEVAKHFIHKAFTPVTTPMKLANGRAPFDLFGGWNHYYLHFDKGVIFGFPVKELLTEEEVKLFNQIVNAITPQVLVRRYSYFFTRQDIFDEYQLVQTAHVALELGAEIPKEQVKGLYFTVCGVKDAEELEQVERVLEAMGLKYVVFREPDIGNEKTSIGVYPVEEHCRGLLRNYNLLRFSKA